MSRFALLFAFLSFATVALSATELVFQQTFDDSQIAGIPADLLVDDLDRGKVLHIAVSESAQTPGRTVSLTLPVEKLRGQRVFFGADVRAEDVSKRPQPWNGVKVMMVIETQSGKDYPQPDIPVGSFGWTKFTRMQSVPKDAKSVVMVLGLEQVTGKVWFDNIRVTAAPQLPERPAADPSKPIYKGHNLPALRGAMAGTSLNEADIEHFANNWNGNLFRWQLFESARQDRPLDKYDEWLDQQLAKFDQVLNWCEKHRVMVVLDLHSPPGGQAFQAGYITARGKIFTDPAAQQKLVEVWQKMATRYKGRQIIWGFDLMNEPDDSMLAEGCLDWNELAEKVAKAVRQIDPDRTIIIEPNGWGSAPAMAALRPIEDDKVVYSIHMYAPHQFTHQGIHGNPTPVSYPGEIAGKQWDKAALEASLQPAIEFSRKYRVHIYVGEFSAIRIAPGFSAPDYLRDVTDILEKHGWDWSYHAYREWQGWSLEHEGPLDKPVFVSTPTHRQQQIVSKMKLNKRP